MTTNQTPVTPSKPPEGSAQPRIVKRYSNRKLYDTVESRYVTLPQIAVLVRNGEDVRIIDNNTKEDLTSVTLAQILYEEERKQSRALPLAALKDLIHTSGEKLTEFFRDGPVGKMLRKDGPEPAEDPAVEAAKDAEHEAKASSKEPPKPAADAKDSAHAKDAAHDKAGKDEASAKSEPGKFDKLVEQSKASFAEWSAAVDERARKVFEGLSPTAQVEKLAAEVKRLSQRVEELESRLAEKSKSTTE